MTVDSLLQELGRPPRDICLDWAWQIQQIFGEQSFPTEVGRTALTWRSLELDELGQLKLVGDNPVVHSPVDLLQQLLSWSTEDSPTPGDGNTLSAVSPTELTKRLRALTLGASEPDVIETIQRSTLPTSQNTSRSHSTRKFKGEFATSENAPRDTVSQTARAKTKRRSVRSLLRRPRAVIALVIAVLIMPVVYCLTSFLDAESDSPAAASPVSNGKQIEIAKNKSVAHPALILDTTVTSPVDSSELAISSASLNAIETRSMETVNEQNAIERLRLPGVDRNTPLVSSVAADEVSLANSESDAAKQNQQLSTGGSGSEADGIHLSNLAQADDEKLDTDVMSEVMSVSKSAESIATESELSGATQPNGKEILDPLVLKTTPTVQVQKLPAKLSLRPRQPVWRIAIAVDEGFSVSPTEPQTLTEREYATWIITDDDDKPLHTNIVLQVQMSSGRQAALKWKIVAATEDFPNLSIPLGEKILLPLIERLRMFTQMATQEGERMKQLTASGISGELRTVVNKQRAEIEAQGKLAGRLLTFVASAHQLESWLHGQVTVFAELRDGAETDADLVLQFGDLDKLKMDDELTMDKDD